MTVWTVLACATAAWARDAVVATSDGRTFEGEVLHEDGSFVTLSVSGIRVKISRTDIVEIQYKQTIEQQYAQRRVLLTDEDVDGRYELAYWLYEKTSYKLASQELADLGVQFPDDQRIVRLKSLVAVAVAAAQSAPPERSTIDAPPVSVRRTVAVDSERRQNKKRVTPQQINLIKVYEIDLDTEPAVVVPRHVVQQVFARYANHPSVPKEPRDRTRFHDSPGYKKLELLFALRAREFYDQVEVREEPSVLREFRAKFHQRYVLNFCGTVACHGGKRSGDFVLSRSDPNSEATVYTNFLTLQSTTVDNQDVINRQQSDRSLLLQYGLARSLAGTPHPEVTGWAPKFQNHESPLFEGIRSWIDSLWNPTPDYYTEHVDLDQPPFEQQP